MTNNPRVEWERLPNGVWRGVVTCSHTVLCGESKKDEAVRHCYRIMARELSLDGEKTDSESIVEKLKLSFDVEGRKAYIAAMAELADLSPNGDKTEG